MLLGLDRGRWSRRRAQGRRCTDLHINLLLIESTDSVKSVNNMRVVLITYSISTVRSDCTITT